MSISTTDDGLLDFAQTFYGVAHTVPESFGLSAVQMTQYQTTLQRYDLALAKTKVPETRNRVSIEQKNRAKATLLRSSRSLVNVCENWPEMTDDKRLQLGITVRKPRSKTTPVPGKPYVKVLSIDDREITAVIQQSSSVRGKPRGVDGANIMVAYGELPESTTGWSFVQTTGKSKTTFTLDAVQEATTAYITAFWFNGGKVTGPAANPVQLNLGATGVLPVGMKIKKAA